MTFAHNFDHNFWSTKNVWVVIIKNYCIL